MAVPTPGNPPGPHVRIPGQWHLSRRNNTLLVRCRDGEHGAVLPADAIDPSGAPAISAEAGRATALEEELRPRQRRVRRPSFGRELRSTTTNTELVPRRHGAHSGVGCSPSPRRALVDGGNRSSVGGPRASIEVVDARLGGRRVVSVGGTIGRAIGPTPDLGHDETILFGGIELFLSGQFEVECPSRAQRNLQAVLVGANLVDVFVLNG